MDYITFLDCGALIQYLVTLFRPKSALQERKLILIKVFCRGGDFCERGQKFFQWIAWGGGKPSWRGKSSKGASVIMNFRNWKIITIQANCLEQQWGWKKANKDLPTGVPSSPVIFRFPENHVGNDCGIEISNEHIEVVRDEFQVAMLCYVSSTTPLQLNWILLSITSTQVISSSYCIHWWY